jgi:nitrate reductase gamma subunit
MLTIIFLSVAVLVFVVGNAVRITKFLRMPTPLRWELYPIPKGSPARQRYGGSYFEDSDWWTKSRSHDHQGELFFMAREILFLKSVRDGFRELWPWSCLLHWGLYLYIAAMADGLAGKLANSGVLEALGSWIFLAACTSGLAGSLGVLTVRAWHPRLSEYSPRTSIFNLLLLGSIFVSGIASFATPANRFSVFSGGVRSTPLSLHLFLVATFLAYFPFTHMTHAYMKFFTWHKVRWNDAPAIDDRNAATTLATNLERKVTWAAAHIAGSDEPTWSEVAEDSLGRGGAKRV